MWKALEFAASERLERTEWFIKAFEEIAEKSPWAAFLFARCRGLGRAYFVKGFEKSVKNGNFCSAIAFAVGGGLEKEYFAKGVREALNRCEYDYALEFIERGELNREFYTLGFEEALKCALLHDSKKLSLITPLLRFSIHDFFQTVIEIKSYVRHGFGTKFLTNLYPDSKNVVKYCYDKQC